MAMAAFTRPATELRRLLHRPNAVRTFVDARVKWVRDPYLDTAVEKEKDLKPMLNLKNLILAQPSKTLPISTAALLKDRLKLPTTAGKLIERYPSVFNPFRPDHPLALPHVKLTAQALVVHNEEARVFNSRNHRKDLAERLAKLLMLAGSRKLPLNVVNGQDWFCHFINMLKGS
ncbi:protein WHAT'S THIS FACTOR 9, mitochondrial isoform X2 [Diospyros lotus]|uniref:protein WHAT'S THIS FACTOR 9, mitochondrial isoform X2 n=1 Tax=Diospyros lotus TaxID=55363 RepID=UPI00225829D4|nr:protein WHAT'S THIS FACTOR 9, mitochondrial isoform X2 [Diospyros lotus]XP_052194694.1 protein WHAT'S THIS FACTOR 9, mitochondrial isoform X2 [Diospyros lotus]